ncbi:MAG: hypothetical protein NC219_10625 [Prevotella sp.]|nr:hypothetical protein [Prevotella sp.]
MKKIVSVLALSALVAGSVFAQAEAAAPAEAAAEKPKAAETKFSVNGNMRLGTNLFGVKNAGAQYWDKDKNLKAKDSETTYGFNDMTKADWGDNLTFKFTGEKAGVEVYTKVSPTSIAMDYGFAWFKFGNSFKLYAGTKDTRGFIKRTNSLDGNWWNNYCEYAKPGIHKDLKIGEGTNAVAVGLDAGNITANNAGSKAANFMGEYAINNNMNVRLALFKGESGTENPLEGFTAAAQFDMKHDKFIVTFTAKATRTPGTDAVDEVKEVAAYKLNEEGSKNTYYVAAVDGKYVFVPKSDTDSTLELKEYDESKHAGMDRYNVYTTSKTNKYNPTTDLVKTVSKKAAVDAKTSTSFGLFVNPIVVDGLDLLVGYTFASADKFEQTNIAHGIDVRAAYKTGAITLTTLNNITINDGDLYSWHTLGFAYKVNDILSAVGIQAKINSGADAWNAPEVNGIKINDSASMNFRPYVDLTAMKNCVVSIGVDVGVSNFLGNNMKDPTITVDIPVAARVKF